MARVLALLVCSALATACADDGDPAGGGAPGVAAARGDGDVGQVGLELTLAPGVNLGALAYAITGPAGFAKNGTLQLTGTDKLVAVISPLPAGNGYTVVVSGGAGDGGPACTGSAGFAVSPGGTTTVALQVRCLEPKKQGSVRIDGTLNVCPVIDGISANPARAFVGSPILLTGAAHDLDGVPAPLGYAWTTTTGAITNPTAAGASFVCPGVGSVAITLQVTDGDCSDRAAITVECVAGEQPPARVRINEIESSGGVPGDWVELHNVGGTTADLSGWIFKDSEDARGYVLPAGTTVAPGGFLVLDEAAFNFGLGSGDSARLFDATGVVLVDAHAWTAHAPVTYGRCPDGTGGFTGTSVATKGTSNLCPTPDAGADADASGQAGEAGEAGEMGTEVGREAPAPIALEPWPGRNEVATVDTFNQFGDNLSGLTYEPGSASGPGVLWAALNSPSLLYRLVWDGSGFTFDTADGWSAGKNLQYPTASGSPDFEGLTRAEAGSPFMYAATERNNDSNMVSRLSILRMDTSVAGTTLVATHEWNLTGDLPVVGPNLGLEAITWVPDSHLVAQGFRDERLNGTYDPAAYPGHGGGLFLAGVEGTGVIYAYALNHDGRALFHRIATIASGQAAVMGLEFDRETGALWAHCDNTCGNTAHVLGISEGRFVVRRRFARPSTLPDSNHEGITFAGNGACQGGLKSFFWSDDSHFGGHALRTDAIPCGPLF